MKFSHWLHQKMKQCNLSQKDLAMLSGISQSAISRWLHDLRSPEPNHLQKIIPILQTSEQECFTAAGLFKGTPTENNQLLSIPFLSPEIPCGIPIETLDQYIIDYRHVSREFVEGILENTLSSHQIYMVKAIGDSMTGKGIYPGDWVLFSPDISVKNGDIGIVFIEETGLCMKEILYQNQILILKSANPSYDPIVLTGDKEARIIGKVLMKIGKL
ncbi:MAG: S24 family peptidase [Caldisericia bacterium]|nr:S24 family peptidase [Caldisericia bacterium]